MNFFSIFFIEKELFTENIKKGVRGNKPNGRTVQSTQLIPISIEAGFCALHFSFRVIHFFSEKMHFCLRN